MWVQTYAPFLDSVVLSAVVALVPIVLVFVLMGVFKRPAHQATIAGLMVALVLAVTVWAMPARLLVSAVMLGVAVALVPLLWTLVGAVWFINLLIHSGYFDVIRRSLTALTPDRRLQTLLIGFGFLGLLEGLVAIGSPVAIGAAMLVGFGFPPITASVVALVGFSHPGVWGPMGLPVVVLQSVTTGIDLDALGVMVGRQVPLLTLVCAPVMVGLVAGWRGLRDVWPITIGTGLAFAIGTFTMSNYGTLYLAGSAGALAAILTAVVWVSVWKPASVWRFPGEPDVLEGETEDDGPPTRAATIRAWAPVGLLVVVMAGISGSPARDALASLSMISLDWPGLHDLVMRTPPVVPAPTPYAAVYSQPLLVVPGTLVMLTGILSLPLLRISAREATVIYGKTVRQLWSAIRVTVSIIALGYVMNYAGLSFTIGVALAVSGFWFPAVAVLLGPFGQRRLWNQHGVERLVRQPGGGRRGANGRTTGLRGIEPGGRRIDGEGDRPAVAGARHRGGQDQRSRGRTATSGLSDHPRLDRRIRHLRDGAVLPASLDDSSRVVGRPHRLGGMISMAAMVTAPSTTAMIPVYPSTSPNFIRVTVRIGIAQNG